MKIGAAKKSQFDGRIHLTLAGLVFFGDFNTITDELPNYFLAKPAGQIVYAPVTVIGAATFLTFITKLSTA